MCEREIGINYLQNEFFFSIVVVCFKQMDFLHAASFTSVVPGASTSFSLLIIYFLIEKNCCTFHRDVHICPGAREAHEGDLIFIFFSLVLSISASGL